MKKSRYIIKIETIRRLIRKDARVNLANVLKRIHPVDLASIMQDLSFPESIVVLEELPDDDTRARIVAEMEPETAAEFLNNIDTELAIRLLKIMPPDDAAAILDNFPEEKSGSLKESILASTDLEQIEDLLTYPEETAGRIMTQEVFALNENLTVQEAIERIRSADRAETVFYIYVIDDDRHLLGVVSLRKLLLENPEKKLRAIMLTDVISVTPDMDQEEVAHIVARYNILAIPVVDEHNTLLGIITVDDIIDIIHDEATEDIYRLAGSSITEVDVTSPVQMARIRFPWLLTRFLAGGIAVAAIFLLYHRIEDFVLWGAFLPMMVNMVVGVGTQSSTIVAEQLALRASPGPKIGDMISGEFFTGLILGLFYSLIPLLALPAAVGWRVSMTIGISLFAGMAGATLIGSILPVAFFKIKKDPILVTGSVVSSILDLFCVLIYLFSAVVISAVWS